MYRKYKSGKFTNNKIKHAVILLEDKEQKLKIINKKTVKIGYNNNKNYKINYNSDYEDYFNEDEY